MTTSDPRWLELLRCEAVATSIGAVALRLGYSRTAISQVLSGKYPGNTAKIEVAALAVLEAPLTVACPYVGSDIPIDTCRATSTNRAPTHNPVLMWHWAACQQCQNRCK